MAIRKVAASAVLGLLFVSLLVIYLLLPLNGLVLFLAVLIMLVSLIVAQSQRWRDIGVMAVFAALVSVVAAALTGRNMFGSFGSVLVPILWALVLLGLFSWTQRNMLIVPRDRAILVVNRYTGSLHTVEGPIAPPLMPAVERKVAVIPLYELSQDVKVENVNTKRLNVDAIHVHIHYRVADPTRALRGIPNRSQVQSQIAKGMNMDLRKAQQDITFWEKLLGNQMGLEVEDIVREVAYNNVFAQNPVELYQRREDLAGLVHDRLSKLVSRWGVDIHALEFDQVDVSQAVFQRLNKAHIRLDSIEQKKSDAEGEAAWIERTGAAQAKAEAMRVAEMVQALKESGVDMTANDLREIVIDAIRAATEWGMEGELARYPIPPVVSGDKR
jgi:regulator of protease activity HflC (stomatin/prohibitin superfamily)